MAAKQKTCANELSLISYVPITQRLKVQQPQMNQFWPAVRQFPAQNFKGKHTCKKQPLFRKISEGKLKGLQKQEKEKYVVKMKTWESLPFFQARKN